MMTIKNNKKNLTNRPILNNIIILFLFFFSIIQNGFSQNRIPITPQRSVEECQKLILEKGDITAYHDLDFTLFRENCYESFLFYSLFMANEYHYSGAYYYVYKSITSFYDKNNINIDEYMLNMALDYLKKGVELNDHNAQINLGELYLEGKYVVQDTIKGKELYAKGWGCPVEKLRPFWREK